MNWLLDSPLILATKSEILVCSPVGFLRQTLYLPLDPFLSLYLPLDPFLSLYLPLNVKQVNLPVSMLWLGTKKLEMGRHIEIQLTCLRL